MDEHANNVIKSAVDHSLVRNTNASRFVMKDLVIPVLSSRKWTVDVEKHRSVCHVGVNAQHVLCAWNYAGKFNIMYFIVILLTD